MKKITDQDYKNELRILYQFSNPIIVATSDMEWFPIENKSYSELSTYFKDSFWAALGIDSEKHQKTYRKWLDLVFMEYGRELQDKALKKAILGKKAYQLNFNFIEDEAGFVNRLYIIFSPIDKSLLESKDKGSTLLKNEVEGLKESLNMSAKMIKNKEIYQSLYSQFQTLTESLENNFEDENYDELQDQLIQLYYGFEFAFEFYHTKPIVKFLKGERNIFDFHNLEAIRRDKDKIIESITKLKNMFININSRIKNYTGDSINTKREFLEIPRKQIEYLTQEIQKNVKRLIIDKLLEKEVFSVLKVYEAALYDLCIQYGKNPVEIKYLGDNFSFPFEKYDSFFAYFFNYLQNVIEHGIETPEKRKEGKKSETGKVTFLTSITSSEARTFYKIEVVDDGKGIHPKAIKEQIQKQGMSLSEGARNAEVFQYLFKKGFSFSDKKKTDMGLYLMKKNIEALSGKIIISSRPGLGTKLEIFLPS
jgi:hypothetical protein